MSKIDWILEKRKIKDLMPHPKNPRLFTKKGMKDLEKSIKNIGMAQPVNITKKGVILSGHARILKLKEMNVDEVDVYVPNVDLTEKQQEEVIVRMNANTAGEWDFEKLANEFELPELTEWGLELPEIESLTPEETVGDDEVPDEPIKSITVKGDLYELGKHRLLCGDSTMIDDCEKLMGGGIADMVFTDPPYNIDYDFSNNGMVATGQRTARFDKIKNDKMSDEKFDQFIKDVFKNILLNLKEGGSYYISASRESTLTFNLMLKELDFHIQSWLIWVKENFNISRLDYHPRHEVITYGWKKGKAHNWCSDRSQTDVLEISREKAGTAVHPTQKPVALLEYLINNSSKAGNLILDFFCGSGSTLITCEKTKRICYGMELDEKYCDVIVKRYIQFCEANGIKPLVKRNGEDCLNEFKA